MFLAKIGEIENSYTAFKYQCSVVVTMSVKEWKQFKTKGQLGCLYGIDISNYVYKATDRKVKAWNPVVDDRQRAKSGIKRIELTYYWNEAA